MKAYRDAKQYRKIPIGYSAADIAELRPNLQNYLSCGTNASEQIDFFALNAYEWCGDVDFKTSGYEILTNMIRNYNVPIWFSETGCQTVRPRKFDDFDAIFGPQMAPYWSGAMVYEWIEEANNYGIIKYGDKVDPSTPGAPPDGFPRNGKPIPLEPEWSNLSKVWKGLKPSSIKEADYKPSVTAPACPDFTAEVWQVQGNAALPTLGQTYDPNAKPTGTSNPPPAGTQSNGAPAPTDTKGAAPGSPVRELRGMGVGLVGVMLGFFWWM